MQIPYTIKERKGKYKKDLQILCIKTGVRKLRAPVRLVKEPRSLLPVATWLRIFLTKR